MIATVPTIGQILGPIPSWLELGPAHDVDGVRVRSVLGDFSRREPCDRPPTYMLDEAALSTRISPFDCSDDREWVKQTLPGRHVSELKGIHSGAVAILFNGSSLADHDLFRIKIPMIGMNRTHKGYAGYRGPQPDYLCIVDWAWLERPSWRSSVVRHPRIINGSSHKDDLGYRVTRCSRMAPFSFDLERDGYVGPIPCSTGHLALQVAAWMGFTELYCLGLDMGGPHFDGTKTSMWCGDANKYHRSQAKLLEARGIRVTICGSPKSACTAFPHSFFEAVC